MTTPTAITTSTATSFFSFAWDGTRLHSNGNKLKVKEVPDGQYVVVVKALKALGAHIARMAEAPAQPSVVAEPEREGGALWWFALGALASGAATSRHRSPSSIPSFSPAPEGRCLASGPSSVPLTRLVRSPVFGVDEQLKALNAILAKARQLRLGGVE